MTITDIIRNEIAVALGHTPFDDEQECFMNYIHDGLADKIYADLPIMLKDVSDAICLCREECFWCCQECGEWFLPSEMNDYGGHYCLNCKPFDDPDVWKDQGE